MNKLFLIVLAVCLVSTHAFVKRDAPADPSKNYLDDIQKQLQDFGTNFNAKVKEAFDPEAIKKNFDQMVDNVNKAIKDMQAKPKA